MTLSRHNKENICSSKTEIFNTERANEQFHIQWFFYSFKIFLISKDPYIKTQIFFKIFG